MPNGQPLHPGDRVLNGDYAETLRLIAREGADALTTARSAGLTPSIWRRRAGMCPSPTWQRIAPRSAWRCAGLIAGSSIVGPPPASSGPLHIIEMLNILEGYDLHAMGFGTPDTLHLLAEVLKIAFADRAAATADPDFVAVPVERLTSKSYAAERRAGIDLSRAQHFTAGVAAGKSANTTHLTVADGAGNIVASTQTINSLFGARYMVPGTGMIPNNYMYLFTPHPGRANSVAPGKRVTSSMSPMIALRDGKPAYALGLPGGLRIFGSAMQGLINLIDHRMPVQQAVEAPRLWTQGYQVEIERGFGADTAQALRDRGHDVALMPTVAGGMSAIQFHPDGTMTGAACWRADGTPIGIGGGPARPGVRFRLEAGRN